MDQINSEILRQIEAQGLTINEGIAVDGHLSKLIARPSTGFLTILALNLMYVLLLLF